MPFFTIFIPSYNRAHTLKRCLDSLVNQTFKDFEVLIVDDGSIDNTKSVVELYSDKLDIRYYWKENGGKHTAINIGIKKCRGKMFMILDSDDYLLYTALEKFHEYWNQINNKDEFSGIMLRCQELNSDKILGIPFPSSPFKSSYIDFHFLSGYKHGGYGDCCEFIRSDILKQYSFPEIEHTKFIPESYIMDQIGLNYNLLCFNEVAKIIEYQKDGITKNRNQYVNSNYLGYLYNIISKLDDIFPKVKKIPKRIKIIYWVDYWKFHKMPYGIKFNVKKMTLLGMITRITYPIINKLRK